jgi:hypothetical protein
VRTPPDHRRSSRRRRIPETRQRGICAPSVVCAHLREDPDAIGRPPLPSFSPFSGISASSTAGTSAAVISRPWCFRTAGADDPLPWFVLNSGRRRRLRTAGPTLVFASSETGRAFRPSVAVTGGSNAPVSFRRGHAEKAGTGDRRAPAFRDCGSLGRNRKRRAIRRLRGSRTSRARTCSRMKGELSLLVRSLPAPHA